MIFGEIYRYNGEWKFNAVGNGTTDPGLGELCQRFEMCIRDRVIQIAAGTEKFKEKYSDRK